MKLSRIIRECLPPKVAWHLTRAAREREQLAEFTRFYSQFITSGDLCFDIGANLGNRTRSFLELGCSVVAAEPQSACYSRLQNEFGTNPKVKLERIAIGRSQGEVELQVSSNHVLSSLSETFITRTSQSGRFTEVNWNKRETVGMVTLDHLITKHGLPSFIKIDVEGFESEVLAGLSQPVRALSFEWVPEFPENAESCIKHLCSLANYEFNLSWGESMHFSRSTWRDADSMLYLVSELQGESSLFGDIYARVKP